MSNKNDLVDRLRMHKDEPSTIMAVCDRLFVSQVLDFYGKIQYDLLPAVPKKQGARPEKLIEILNGFYYKLDPDRLGYDDVRNDLVAHDKHDNKAVGFGFGGFLATMPGFFMLLENNLELSIPLIAAGVSSIVYGAYIGSHEKHLPYMEEYRKLLNNASRCDNILYEHPKSLMMRGLKR
jgi:hypothetical protein